MLARTTGGIVALARVVGPAYLTRRHRIPCTGGWWRSRNVPRICVRVTWGLGYRRNLMAFVADPATTPAVEYHPTHHRAV